METNDSRALSLFRVQAGVISRQQAMALGFTKRQIDYRLGRDWQSVGRGVYIHAAFEHSIRMSLFMLTLSNGGYISHRHAARLHQLEPTVGRRPEVTSRSGLGLRLPSAEILIHESKQIDTADLITIDGLPVSGVARTIMDVAAVEPREWRVLALIDSARRKGLTTPEELRACLRRHARRGRDGTVRFRTALRAIDDNEPVPIGHLSRQVAELLCASGLPYPRFEERIYDRFGNFIAQVDSSWVGSYVQFYDGFTYHGAVREQTNRDRWQRQQLRQEGYVVDEFTYDQITRDPGYVVRASHDGFRRAQHRLRQEGQQGQPGQAS